MCCVLDECRAHGFRTEGSGELLRDSGVSVATYRTTYRSFFLKENKMPYLNDLHCEESFHQTNKKLTRKIRENILSGRWPAESPAEVRLLKEHLKKKRK